MHISLWQECFCASIENDFMNRESLFVWGCRMRRGGGMRMYILKLNPRKEPCDAPHASSLEMRTARWWQIFQQEYFSPAFPLRTKIEREDRMKRRESGFNNQVGSKYGRGWGEKNGGREKKGLTNGNLLGFDGIFLFSLTRTRDHAPSLLHTLHERKRTGCREDKVAISYCPA